MKIGFVSILIIFFVVMSLFFGWIEEFDKAAYSLIWAIFLRQTFED